MGTILQWSLSTRDKLYSGASLHARNWAPALFSLYICMDIHAVLLTCSEVSEGPLYIAAHMMSSLGIMCLVFVMGYRNR